MGAKVVIGIVFAFLISISFLWFSRGLTTIQLSSVPASDYDGLPAYRGSCGAVVRSIYQGIAANRYLSEHVSANPEANKKFYKEHVAGYVNGAFSYAQFCQDKEAVGMLLMGAANVTLDEAFDHVIPYSEAVRIATSFDKQAVALGYTQEHPMEQAFIRGRLERNTMRAQLHADV